MAKLLTGTRIYGTGTVDTQLFVSGTNSATSTTTGALQVVGGVGIGGNLYVGGTIFGGTLSGTASTATNADNIKTVLQTSSASHYLAFVDANNSTAAYEALYTTSSFIINPQSGTVGIGTATITSTLEVFSSSPGVKINDGISNVHVQVNGSNPRVVFIDGRSGGRRFDIGSSFSTATFSIIDRTAGIERLLIDANGNIGIGTTTPASKFVVYGGTVNSTTYTSSEARIADGTLHLMKTSAGGVFEALRAINNDTTVGTTVRLLAAATSDPFNNANGGKVFIDAVRTASNMDLIFSLNDASGAAAVERLRILGSGAIAFNGSTSYGVSGQILQSNGNAAPTWISTGSLAAANATTATHLSGGVAGQIPYQTAPGVTSFLSTGTAGDVLVSNGSSAATYNNTLRLAGSTNATSTTSGALQVVGGVGVGGDLFIQGDIRTNDTLFNLINGNATTVNFAGDATALTMGASGSGTTNVRNNLTVSGNLTVQGTTTIVDSTVTNIADPIITLGGSTGNSAPTADDNKDRGVAFKWVNNAGSTSTGFFGYDDSTGYFTYVQTATITNEVVSGTKGAMDVNLAGGTAMSIVYQSSPDNTAFLAASTSGYILQTNGTGSPPTWVSASGVSAGSAANADNVRTIAQTASATYYPTFVDSNNASNAYESVYTTSSFYINPATGQVNHVISNTASTGIYVATPSTQQLFPSSGYGGAITVRDQFATASNTSFAGINFQSSPGNDYTIGKWNVGSTSFLAFYQANTPTLLMVLTASGNLGVGTTSPGLVSGMSKYITLSSTGTAEATAIELAGNRSSASQVTGRISSVNGVIGANAEIGRIEFQYQGSTTLGSVGIYTSGSERVRVDSSGNLLVGDSNGGYGKLTITGSTSTSGVNIWVRNTSDTAGDNVKYAGIQFSVGTDDGSTAIRSYRTNSGADYSSALAFLTKGVGAGATTPTERMRLTANGGIAFGGASNYGSSGFVLKSNGDAAPTWVDPSTLASASSTNADNIRTLAQAASATYYPTFVDSNNASNAYELVYTTGTIVLNPSYGSVGIGANPSINSYGSATTSIKLNLQHTPPQNTTVDDVLRLSSKFIAAANTASAQIGSGPAIVFAGGIGDNQSRDRARIVAVYEGSNLSGLAFHTQTTADTLVEAMRITNNGRVGIGTTSSNAKLHVTSTGEIARFESSGGSGRYIRFNDSGATKFNFIVGVQQNVDDGFEITPSTTAGGSTFSTPALAITSAGGISFGGTASYGSSGQILQSNGNAAPTWIALSSRTVGTSTQVNTVLQTANATYYPTFVDSNNASATAESLYTTSSFVINPATGNVGFNKASPTESLYIERAGTQNLIFLNQSTSASAWVGMSIGYLGTEYFAAKGNVNTGEFQLGGKNASGYYTTIYSNNAETVRVTGGNVGIGTSSPGYPLVVQTNGTSSSPSPSGSNIALRLQSTQTNYAVGIQFSDNVTNATWITMQGGGFRFTTANPGAVQAMNISGSGNVGIGTTSTTNKFEVAGTAGQLFSVSDSFTGTIFSANDVSGIPSIEVLDTGLVKLAQYNGQLAIGTGTVASSTVTVSIYGMLQTMGTLGEIRASSEITAYYSSDARLKENIKLIENPITIIDQIRGVTFDWTDEHMARRGGEDGYFVRKHDIGVIAQEVQAVLPELVGTREDGYLAVKYEKMVPLLIEAIKAQQKTIDLLVKDLANVKEFINDLKNKNESLK